MTEQRMKYRSQRQAKLTAVLAVMNRNSVHKLPDHVLIRVMNYPIEITKEAANAELERRHTEFVLSELDRISTVCN